MPRDLRLSRRFSKSGNTPAGSMRPSPTRRLLICGTITAIAQGEEPGYDDGGQGDYKYRGASGRGRGGAERGGHLGRNARVQIGRAACRGRVEISVVAVSLKKKRGRTVRRPGRTE